MHPRFRFDKSGMLLYRAENPVFSPSDQEVPATGVQIGDQVYALPHPGTHTKLNGEWAPLLNERLGATPIIYPERYPRISDDTYIVGKLVFPHTTRTPETVNIGPIDAAIASDTSHNFRPSGKLMVDESGFYLITPDDATHCLEVTGFRTNTGSFYTFSDGGYRKAMGIISGDDGDERPVKPQKLIADKSGRICLFGQQWQEQGLMNLTTSPINYIEVRSKNGLITLTPGSVVPDPAPSELQGNRTVDVYASRHHPLALHRADATLKIHPAKPEFMAARQHPAGPAP